MDLSVLLQCLVKLWRKWRWELLRNTWKTILTLAAVNTSWWGEGPIKLMSICNMLSPLCELYKEKAVIWEYQNLSSVLSHFHWFLSLSSILFQFCWHKHLPDLQLQKENLCLSLLTAKCSKPNQLVWTFRNPLQFADIFLILEAPLWIMPSLHLPDMVSSYKKGGEWLFTSFLNSR